MKHLINRGVSPGYQVSDFDALISRVEQAAGGVLPVDYREWLRLHRSTEDEPPQTPYDLTDLIETQRIVQDVIPPGTLAIGDDGYGNLVLLRFVDGSIEWWNHERDEGDNETETMRDSFTDYLALIAEKFGQ